MINSTSQVCTDVICLHNEHTVKTEMHVLLECKLYERERNTCMVGSMGARRGGQEGALAPPWKFTDMGGPPKDNLTRNFKKKIKGTPYSKRRN